MEVQAGIVGCNRILIVLRHTESLMRIYSSLRRYAGVVALMGLSACSGGSEPDSPTGPSPSAPVLKTVTVSLSANSIKVGQTVTATAAGKDQFGMPIGVGSVTWVTSPSGIANITQAGAVTGVAVGTAAVYAQTGVGNVFAQLTVTPVFTLWERFGGGYICYIDNSGIHGLISSDTYEFDVPYMYDGRGDSTWSPGNKVTGATSTSDGKSNTAKIISAHGNGNYAAKMAADYRGGGYADWFLPALNQAQQCLRPGPYAIFWTSTETNLNQAKIRVSYSGTGDNWSKFLIADSIFVRVF
jgi:hypothetical protein